MDIMRPVFKVDFNEMVDSDVVLLSAEDFKTDASGVVVPLYEGMYVSLYEDDCNENNEIDDLVANGVVVRNVRMDWSAHVKWCCRIDRDGVRAESKVNKFSGD